jgi:hypothetical protein
METICTKQPDGAAALLYFLELPWLGERVPACLPAYVHSDNNVPSLQILHVIYVSTLQGARFYYSPTTTIIISFIRRSTSIYEYINLYVSRVCIYISVFRSRNNLWDSARVRYNYVYLPTYVLFLSLSFAEQLLGGLARAERQREVSAEKCAQENS